MTAPAADVALRIYGGWAFGAEHALARAELVRTGALGPISLAGYLNQPHDVGVAPAASGLVNTLSALIAGADFTELFSATGISLSSQRELGAAWSADLGVRAERHRSLERSASTRLFEAADFRDVRPIDAGDFAGATVALRRGAPSGTDHVWRAELRTDLGALSAGDATAAFAQPRVAASAERNWVPRDSRLEVDVSAGATLGEIPRQALYLVGGRGTVAGYGFREFGGDRFVLGRATLSADVNRPWLRGRVFGEAGWTGVGEQNRATLQRWGAAPTDGVITSVGAGVGIFYDLLRVDLARGLDAGGRWELSVEAQRAFWGWL